MRWTAEKIWNGGTCCILAGGPSLRGFNAQRLFPRFHVLAVNDSWRIAPWADVKYFCDAEWWRSQVRFNRIALDGVTPFSRAMCAGLWVSGSDASDVVGNKAVHCLLLTGERGLELDPSGLRHGNNSGYQAINLAVHLGARRIVLLGYDMRVGARSHWHDEERPDDFASVLACTMLPCFDSLVDPLRAAGVEVINATPDSALRCFPTASLESLLEAPGDGGATYRHSRPSDAPTGLKTAATGALREAPCPTS